jgi:hypothetical protein
MSLLKICVIATAAIAVAGSSMRVQGQEPEEKATVADGGVKVSVAADRWTARPATLTEVIPLEVTIENNSKAPLRVRYDAFGLRTPAGQWLPALPPFEIEGAENVPVDTRYPFAADGFHVAPHLWRRYPYFSRFDGPFYYDPLYYSSFYPAFRRVMLPTADMVHMALPEGVLNQGGRITGFLYFESADFERDRGTFAADLIDARTLRRLGRVEAVLEID